MSINKRIKEIRQAVNLPQSKFAERIAISTSYFQGIECGSKNVNERNIRIICIEFGIDEHWLRTGEGSMFRAEGDIELIKATSIFKSLNPRFRKSALTFLNELTELQNDNKV